jgi:hypothetical protein
VTEYGVMLYGLFFLHRRTDHNPASTPSGDNLALDCSRSSANS